ncbi:DNA alkylation repair protein [Flavobacteriaceae bacterium 3-367]
MAELFKNIYSTEFFEKFTAIVELHLPRFDRSAFLEQIYDDEWENRELKQRMRHISLVLKDQLSDDFEQNAEFILKIIPELREAGFRADKLEFIFLPDFVEIYGLKAYGTSVKTMEQLTQFVSCEFAVRPFVITYEKEMMAQMLSWSKHDHPAVRRLASEGCRPRLPWAMAIPALKDDPALIFPILENLKNDVSEDVRRSVANNLNDISKDHPELVVSLAKKWKGKRMKTDKLLKHACRTLLKQGSPEVMQLFGFGDVRKIKLEDLQILTPKVKIGESLEFSCKLINTARIPTKVRLEYGLYYQKANGTLSKKVFKISEMDYPESTSHIIRRKQPFKPITTRRFHLGRHQLSIILNGRESDRHDFELVG